MPNTPSPRRPDFDVAVLVFALLALAALVGVLSALSRTRYCDEAATSARNLAEIISDDIELTVSRAHSNIRAFSLLIAPGDLSPAVPARRRREVEAFMTAHLFNFPQVTHYRVFTAEGDALFGAGRNPASFNVADREWFRALRDDPAKDFVISEVLVARGTGMPTVILGVPVRGSDGRFLGAVNANLDLSYFQQLIDRPDIGPHGLIAIRRSESSRLVLRRPHIASQVNEPAVSVVTQRIAAGEASGTQEVVSPIDGVTRTTTFRQAHGYPLATIVGLAHTDFLRPWTLQTWLAGGATLVFEAVLIALFAWQRRTQRRLDDDLEERKAIEASLRTSEEKLRNFYELSPLGIALTDMQGRYLEFNEAFRQICGYPADELKALDYWTLTPKKYEADEARQLESLRQTGRYGPYEKEYVRKDGSTIPLLLNGVLVTGRGGGQYIWSLVEDISEQRQTRQRLEQLLAEQRAMLESDLVAIVKTRSRVITWCNPAFEKMLGYEPGELIGAGTARTHVSPEAYGEIGAAAYPVLMAGHIYRAQIELARKDGQRIWVDIGGAMLDREATSQLWAIIDITERKKAENALARAKDAAEAANVAKSQFLATMSHEIRTPMNGVLGMAQLLLLPDLTEAERQEFARVILNSGQTLLTLLNDILDLSKVEAGKVELQCAVFQPGQLIEEVAALFEEVVRAKGIRIEFAWRGDAGARFRADPIRLRQILTNLAGNAVKFTPTGFVRIEGGTMIGADGGTCLEFSVTDSGIGIPLDKQDLLFKPFSQVDATSTREYGGTGLGLSIVRSLARLMGGDVGVDSAPGRGSRFWCRVRADRVAEGDESRQIPRDAAPAEEAATTHRAAAAPCFVLVVEDNPINRRVVEALLKKQGVHFESVENGREAVDRIVAGLAPDLVLMDCQMPVLDGYAATGEIRRWEQETGRPRIPIVALTASAFQEDRERCLAAGMDGFIAKPVDAEHLRAAIDRYPARA